MPNNSWNIVYRTKIGNDVLRQRLEKVGVEHYIPVQTVEVYDDVELKEKEELAIRNLIFVRTEEDVFSLVKQMECLRGVFLDCATGKPAVVSDKEMQRFRLVMEAKPTTLKMLENQFSAFTGNPHVRVIAGPYEGLEGYLVRIRRDKKLVFSLGNQAIALSGIHFSMFEKID